MVFSQRSIRVVELLAHRALTLVSFICGTGVQVQGYCRPFDPGDWSKRENYRLRHPQIEHFQDYKAWERLAKSYRWQATMTVVKTLGLVPQDSYMNFHVLELGIAGADPGEQRKQVLPAQRSVGRKKQSPRTILKS